jgi:O-antigen/teichoic acid export membrane protein
LSHDEHGGARGPESTPSRDAAHAARSGAMQTLTIAVQGSLSITHVLLARLFGQAVFGSYQSCLATLEIVTRAGTGGADKGMLRYIAAYRAQGDSELERSALGTGLRLCIGVAGVLALSLIAASGLVAEATHTAPFASALRVMAPAAVFTGCVYVLVNASLGTKVTYANFVVRGLGEPLLLMAAGLLAALFGRNLIQLAGAHLIAAAATFVLALFVVGRVFGRGEIARALRSRRLPGFARYSIPLGAAEMTNAILQRADIILVTTLVGPSMAAVYAAAEFLSRVIGNARSVFDAVAAPVFSEAIHLDQRDRLLYNLRLMGRWVATAAVPIAVTVIALRRELLSLYGPGFTAGATAMILLAASQLVNATLGLCGYVLVVGGWSRLMFVNNVLAALTNIGLCLALIPRFGIIGAAAGALAGVTVIGGLMAVEVRLTQGISPMGWSILKPFAAGAIALGLELAVGRWIDPPALRVPLVIIVGLVSYLGVLAALRLAPEDRRLLESAWRRVRSR